MRSINQVSKAFSIPEEPTKCQKHLYSDHKYLRTVFTSFHITLQWPNYNLFSSCLPFKFGLELYFQGQASEMHVSCSSQTPAHDTLNRRDKEPEGYNTWIFSYICSSCNAI